MTSISNNQETGARPPERKTYRGKVVSSNRLTGKSSSKETHHIIIAPNEPLNYLPGEVAAIMPKNKPEIVEKLIALSGLDAETVIDHPKKKGPLEKLLLHHLNTSYLLRSTISQYAAITGHDIPNIRMSLYDILRKYPLKSKEQFFEIIKTMSLLAPRLYSIASSPAAHGAHEFHITVVKDRFRVGQEERSGVGSKYLTHLEPGSDIEFFIQKSKHFKLPDDKADIIMVGPGTGIAPFRSFLFERAARKATGRNWLFFGEQHINSDFLYQTELQKFLKTGLLAHLDLAFSRDQPEKIYVQHRIGEKGAEIYSWLINGAFLYVCGKRDPMSKDVENILLEIFKTQGNMNGDEAKTFLNKLSGEGRYMKDVY